MEKLIRKTSKETNYSPFIDFNPDTGIWIISGESYMENPCDFYVPVIEWVKSFIKTRETPVHLKIQLNYFNTSTTRCLLSIFNLIREHKELGKAYRIQWELEDDDPGLVEEIEDLQVEANVKINIIEKSEGLNTIIHS